VNELPLDVAPLVGSKAIEDAARMNVLHHVDRTIG
jgi:hypothetical protein